MKISICFPQFNRIEYLLKSLEIISKQTYDDIEICISDDCSTDNTVDEINKLKLTYRYPIIFEKFETNQGYDRNLRRSMELATGDYCFTLGNDDTLNDPGCIQRLVAFFNENDRPEIGYCNYANYSNRGQIAKKALQTAVIGSGQNIALNYYASFIFVGGYIIRRDVFLKYNTPKFDGSVYVQMYLSTRAILGGYRFFTISEVMVLSGIFIRETRANSFRDKLTKKWSKIKIWDGGILDVVWVIIAAFNDSGIDNASINYKILKKHYVQSMTYWLLEYRNCGGFVDAVGIVLGMYPAKVVKKYTLGIHHKIGLFANYFIYSAVGLFTPVFIFNKLRFRIYNYIKSRQMTTNESVLF